MKPSGRHLILECRMRRGETCWSSCDTCPEVVAAATPEELVEAWYAHRLRFGLRSNSKAPTGEPSSFGRFHFSGPTPVAEWKRVAV